MTSIDVGAGDFSYSQRDENGSIIVNSLTTGFATRTSEGGGQATSGAGIAGESSIGESVLHEHLKEWCVRVGCLPEGHHTANGLGIALYRNGHLTIVEKNKVSDLSAIGRQCQENDAPPIVEDAIPKVLNDIGEFIASHPLP